MKTKTAEQILHKYFHHFKSERTRDLIVKAMEEYRQQPYASQPMSAEPTVQQLREASKNNPDTFLAGALYVVDNYKLNSPLMSSEQYSSGAIHSLGEFPTTKSMSAEQVCRWVKASEREPKKNGLYHYKEDGGLNQIVFFDKDEGFFTIRLIGEKKLKKPERVPVKKNRDEFYWLDESTAPAVKADGWVSVEDKLPEVLETVWVSNGKGWTALGCRTDYYENDEGGFDWCWAGSNGIIYEESGKIVSECEEDDLDVRFWHPLPEPPVTK